MIKICENCWVEFNAQCSKVKCCSVKCANEKRTKYKNLKCINCWLEFHPLNSKQRFCCIKCSKHWSWNKYTCLYCWKDVYWWASIKQYCNEECKRLYKRQNNKVCFCANCWNAFKPWHKWWKYCSNTCKRNARRTIDYRKCPICWLSFLPAKNDKVYCSKKCYSISQSIDWKNKTKEEQDYIVYRMQKWNKQKVSKINKSFIKKLSSLWFNVWTEKELWQYYYDLCIWNVLIEINPRIHHNSTRNPYWKIIDKYYHFNKTKCAIDNWYRIILVWDWTDFDLVVNLIQSDFITKQSKISIHWYNWKTKEHIIWNNMDDLDLIKKWFVKIYDWWETYSFI